MNSYICPVHGRVGFILCGSVTYCSAEDCGQRVTVVLEPQPKKPRQRAQVGGMGCANNEGLRGRSAGPRPQDRRTAP
jgi:hypothetical protein